MRPARLLRPRPGGSYTCPQDTPAKLRSVLSTRRRRNQYRPQEGERGECTRARTWDLLVKSQLLYQLSYAPTDGLRIATEFAKGSPQPGELAKKSSSNARRPWGDRFGLVPQGLSCRRDGSEKRDRQPLAKGLLGMAGEARGGARRWPLGPTSSAIP